MRSIRIRTPQPVRPCAASIGDIISFFSLKCNSSFRADRGHPPRKRQRAASVRTKAALSGRSAPMPSARRHAGSVQNDLIDSLYQIDHIGSRHQGHRRPIHHRKAVRSVVPVQLDPDFWVVFIVQMDGQADLLFLRWAFVCKALALRDSSALWRSPISNSSPK